MHCYPRHRPPRFKDEYGKKHARPVSGLTGFDTLSPSHVHLHTVASGKELPDYRCGGSGGIAVKLTALPVSTIAKKTQPSPQHV